MRIFFRIIGFALLLAMVLLIVPALINLDSYRDQISKNVEDGTGHKFTITGKVKGAFLPYPRITLESVELANNAPFSDHPFIKAKSFTGYLSLLPLFSKKIVFTSITMEGADLQLEMLNGEDNWHVGSNSQSLDHIDLKNSTVSLTKENSLVLDHVAAHNMEIDFEGKDKMGISGVLSSDTGPVKIKANLNPDNLTFSVDTGSLNIDFKGDINHSAGGNKYITGKLNGSIPNMAAFSRSNLATYLPSSIVIKSREHGEFHTDVNAVEDEIMLDHITYASTSLTADGSIRVSLDNLPIVDMEMAVHNLDVDHLIESADNKSDKANTGTPSNEIIPHSNSHSFGLLSDRFNALLYITFDNVMFHQQKMTNGILNAELFNSEIEIYPSTFTLPGNVPFEISGNITHNEIRPIFDGKISLSGSNIKSFLAWAQITDIDPPDRFIKPFLFRSNLTITPSETRFSSINSTFGNTIFSGLMSIRLGGIKPIFNGSLNASHINLDDYGFSSVIYNKFLTAFANNSQSNQSELQWLRNIPYKISMEVHLDDAILNQEPIRSLSAILTMDAASLSLDKFIIDSDLANFNGSLTLDMHTLHPQMDISVNGDHFDTDFFDEFIPDNPVDLHKVSDDDDNAAKALAMRAAGKSYWPMTPLNFIRLDKFKGTINIALGTFSYNELELKNLVASLKMENSFTAVNKLTADVFGGKLLAQGAVGTIIPSISLSYSLASVDMNEVFSFMGINTIHGLMSSTGTFNMQGISPALMIASCQANVQVLARDITVDGIDINKVFDSAAPDTSYDPRLYQKLLVSAASKGKTVIKSINALFRITNGLMNIRQLVFSLPRANGIAVGAISLSDWMVKVAANMAFTANGAPDSLTLGISLTGSLDKPDIKFDTKVIEEFIKNHQHVGR